MPFRSLLLVCCVTLSFSQPTKPPPRHNYAAGNGKKLAELRKSHPQKKGGNLAAHAAMKGLSNFHPPPHGWGNLFKHDKNSKIPAWAKKLEAKCITPATCGLFSFCHVKDGLHHESHCMPCLAMMQKQCMAGTESSDGNCHHCDSVYKHFHPKQPHGVLLPGQDYPMKAHRHPTFDMKHLNASHWEHLKQERLERGKANKAAMLRLQEFKNVQEDKLSQLEMLRRTQHEAVAAALRGQAGAKKEADSAEKQVNELTKQWKQEDSRLKKEEANLKKEELSMKNEEAEWVKYKSELEEMTKWEEVARNDEKVLQQYETTEKEEMSYIWAALGVIGFGFSICFYCCCMTSHFKEYLFEKMAEYEKLKAQSSSNSEAFEMPKMDKGFRTSPSEAGSGSGEFNDIDLGDMEEARADF